MGQPSSGAIDTFLTANATYVEGFPEPHDREPELHVAVLACMDSRLALFGALGLRIGDAHLVRNAGGIATPDTLRSLAISQRKLNTREVAVIQHTDCGMLDFDDARFRAELAAESGQQPPWDVPGFTDVEQSVRDSVAAIRSCPWLVHRDSVRGFVFDVRTAEITEVR
ncbi:carbonic anhydrase [Jatrophihabitans telluris]|uniref:carbonic anhydrase n=1 Tax=Jatrophihabitans telluris TaxID=2038343 RepID=A0ABY4QWM5_9ACTN|nr:carbonic anhydrase [Jatrophihabitans telluris]UQX88046.1 carbonic anhydrase [Jatrophihabitans telluris]